MYLYLTQVIPLEWGRGRRHYNVLKILPDEKLFLLWNLKMRIDEDAPSPCPSHGWVFTGGFLRASLTWLPSCKTRSSVCSTYIRGAGQHPLCSNGVHGEAEDCAGFPQHVGVRKPPCFHSVWSLPTRKHRSIPLVLFVCLFSFHLLIWKFRLLDSGVFHCVSYNFIITS